MASKAGRSIAQRMKDRAKDLDTAGDYQVAGKKSPAVGGAKAPKPLPKSKKR